MRTFMCNCGCMCVSVCVCGHKRVMANCRCSFTDSPYTLVKSPCVRIFSMYSVSFIFFFLVWEIFSPDVFLSIFPNGYHHLLLAILIASFLAKIFSLLFRNGKLFSWKFNLKELNSICRYNIKHVDYDSWNIF